MRLLLRTLGTLLIAVAMILLIIDGTKSLAANTIVTTSLNDSWQQIHAASLEQFRTFLASRFFGAVLETVASAILNFPGWAVIGLPGIFLAWAGRSRRERVFIRSDQI
ncbi:MAG: hypothetical protein ABL879_00410 [Devosia sp.]